MSGKSKFDLHLSGMTISKESIATVEAMGFVRDEFANSKFCLPNDYHATYRGETLLPDDKLWADAVKVLDGDESFIGNLEEEEHLVVVHVDGNSQAVVTSRLPAFEMHDVPAGEHKACDIHIAVQLDHVSISTLEAIEQLKMVSFDRATFDGIRRVFSVTCQTLEDGQAIFSALQTLLHALGAQSRIKMEGTTRYFRKPDDAQGLPIVDSHSALAWLSALEHYQ